MDKDFLNHTNGTGEGEEVHIVSKTIKQIKGHVEKTPLERASKIELEFLNGFECIGKYPKSVSVYGGTKIKPGNFAVPPGVVTATSPEAAPSISAWMLAPLECATNDFAGTPPNVTAVAPCKFEPCI